MLPIVTGAPADAKIFAADWSRVVAGTTRTPRELARPVGAGLQLVRDHAWPGPDGAVLVPRAIVKQLPRCVRAILTDAGALPPWSLGAWRLRIPPATPAASWHAGVEAWSRSVAGWTLLDRHRLGSADLMAALPLIGADSLACGQDIVGRLLENRLDPWRIEGVLVDAGVLHYRPHGWWTLTVPPGYALVGSQHLARAAA